MDGSQSTNKEPGPNAAAARRGGPSSERRPYVRPTIRTSDAFEAVAASCSKGYTGSS